MNLVRRVQKIYRVNTETEAVTKALEEVLFREQLRCLLRSTAGKLPNLEKVF